jgi:hypothetical protein
MRAGTNFLHGGAPPPARLSLAARRHLELQHEWDMLLHGWCVLRHRHTVEAFSQLEPGALLQCWGQAGEAPLLQPSAATRPGPCSMQPQHLTEALGVCCWRCQWSSPAFTASNQIGAVAR